jgi:hypothetical protein
MPICGKCLRMEENVRIKDDVKLKQAIDQAKERPFEIVNALDLIIKDKENTSTTI